LHMRQLLKTKLVDMDLSVRALNCLKAAWSWRFSIVQ
jgi:DNA-directed RNA polymerase subunit alpha